MNNSAVLEPPANTATVAIDRTIGPLADLILVRLLATGKIRPSLAIICKDIQDLIPHHLSSQAIKDVVQSLRAAGSMMPKGQELTDLGRERAFDYLGINKLPSKANWAQIKSKYLAPKALGLSSAEAKTIEEREKLAAYLLRRKFDLPMGTGKTLIATIQALVCKELGFPDTIKLNDLVRAVLSNMLGEKSPLTFDKLKKTAPQVLLGTKRGGKSGLLALAISQLFEVNPEPDAFDIETFANTVVAAARTCPTGWFGSNKVFIGHVWDRLSDQPQIAPLGIDGFKSRLIEANQKRLLTLSRADLTQNMERADLDASKTSYLNANYHFILVEDRR